MITLDDLRVGSPALCGSFNKIKEEAIRVSGGDEEEADQLLTQRILYEFIQYNVEKRRHPMKKGSAHLGSGYACEKPDLIAPYRKGKRTIRLRIMPIKKPEYAAINYGDSVAQGSARLGYGLDLLAPDKKRKEPDSAADNSGNNAESNHSEEQQVEGKSMQLKRQRKNPGLIQQMGPDPPPDLPTKFRDRIMGMHGYDIKLVIQKEMSNTDLSKRCDRLSIPNGQMRAEFLTEEEKADMEKRKKDGIHFQGLQVPLIEPSLEESSISLKRWKLGSSTTYILSSPWIEVAERNGLKSEDVVQLWSFKADQRPCFALVKLQN